MTSAVLEHPRTQHPARRRLGAGPPPHNEEGLRPAPPSHPGWSEGERRTEDGPGLQPTARDRACAARGAWIRQADHSAICQEASQGHLFQVPEGVHPHHHLQGGP